jgi:hypothetical protein
VVGRLTAAASASGAWRRGTAPARGRLIASSPTGSRRPPVDEDAVVAQTRARIISPARAEPEAVSVALVAP